MDMRWIVHIFVWTHVVLFLLADCFYDGFQVWLGRFMGGSICGGFLPLHSTICFVSQAAIMVKKKRSNEALVALTMTPWGS